MKRKLALFLAAMMAASSLPMTAYAATFKDINDVPWAAGVISSVADKGLLSGYEDGTFRGKNNVTYCEAMQMVYTALNRTGAAQPFDAVTAYGYMSVLDTYKVPKWAQMAVAYGLSTGVVDMQTVATKFAGGTKAATREDVAILFGNALTPLFGKDRDTSAVKTFADYWSISTNAMEQVDLLKKLGVLSGDEYNRFNPKQNINRAEMAVMLNKTYGVVADGVAESGELVEILENGDNYYFRIKLDKGGTEGFRASEGQIPVYVGNTSQKIAMNQLVEGDKVQFVFSGTELIAIRQMNTTGVQGKYEITGYVTSLKDNTLSVENENTGETDKYNIKNGAAITVDRKKVSLSELRDILKDRYDEHAFAGINTKTERVKENNEYMDKVYVDTLDITFVEEYTVVGEVKSFGKGSITVKQADGGAERSIVYAADVAFYIGDEKASYEDLNKLNKEGTTYAKVTVDQKDKATKIVMAEDTFASTNKDVASRTYKLSSISDKKLVLEDGGKKYTYEFGTKNPLKNITFYLWDGNDDWDRENDVDKAESQTDKWMDKGDVYVKLTFNSGDRLSEVYFSDQKNAWKNSPEHQSERKGTVASIKDDVLKFKTSSVEYKLLKKYDGGDDESKLNILGVPTSSKTVLTRMANDDAIELYAEITANGSNEAIKIEARAKSAIGKLVEWDRDEKIIEIKTDDGNTFKLKTMKSPKLTDEEENVFDLDDIEGNRYVGKEIELGFNSNGVVDTFTMTDGAQDAGVTVKVKGVATAADNGLKVNGKTYPWLSKTADISVSNYSCPQESLAVVKKLIEDPDVKVYVEAALDDKGRVESIKAYVQAAEGELTAYEDSIRILTDSGNKFSFIPNSKLDKCDVNGWNQDKLEDSDRGVGYDVALKFDKDGDVCEMVDR